MSGGDPRDADRRSRRGRGRWLRRVTTTLVLLVLLVLAAGVASYRFDLGTRWLGEAPPSPISEPAQVPPPAGLTLPPPRRVLPVAVSSPPRPVDRAAVRRAVTPLLASPKLGRHVVVLVEQQSNGAIVYRHGSGAVTPASTMKMLTMVSALQTLGPQHRFTTSVVATRASRQVVLVGGGDPLLRRRPTPGEYPVRADLDTLASRAARALEATGRHRVRLGYDTTLFSGPAVDPRWEPSYIPDGVISRISPLWVDEGREPGGAGLRSPDPALAAARSFADSLRRRHITVLGDPHPAVAPPASTGGHPLAAVPSPPLAEIVQHVVEVSDNEGAEVLSRQVAVAQGRPASFEGAAGSVRAVLRSLGVSTAGDRIFDGSGLSRHDRLRPETLLGVIRVATSPRHPGLSSAVVDLPVAGFSGSLAHRFQTGSSAGLGRVRAKTGTLTGVHGLTGTVTSVDGAVMRFVAIADRVRPIDTLDARQGIDEVAAALAGCRCATP